MAVDFTNTLIVAISATALFDLSESENYLIALFIDCYRLYHRLICFLD